MGIDPKLWVVVSKGNYPITNTKAIVEADCPNHILNSKAMTILQNSLPPRVTFCKTANEIWKSNTYVGTAKVKEAKADSLIVEFDNFSMKDGESVREMADRLINITTSLHNLGEKISSNRIRKKLLHALPPPWTPKVTTLLEIFDLST